MAPFSKSPTPAIHEEVLQEFKLRKIGKRGRRAIECHRQKARCRLNLNLLRKLYDTLRLEAIGLFPHLVQFRAKLKVPRDCI